MALQAETDRPACAFLLPLSYYSPEKKSTCTPVEFKMPVCLRKRLLSPVVCLCAGIALILCAGAAGAGRQSVPPSEQPSLSVQAGQMLMLGFRGLTAESSDWVLEDIRAGRAGGVILFDYDVQLDRPLRNIKNPDQVKTLIHDLQAAARLPLLVAVDQEGGRVCRLKPGHGFPDFPGAQELGSINDPGLTQATAHRMGRLLQELGFNCNLAPVVDVNVNPQNPAIGKLGRSFSPDPETVVRQARAFITGLQAGGVLSCLKHFPGHGSAFNDSHLGLTDITHTWEPLELIPYQDLIRSGHADLVMTGHLFNADLDARFPATLSQRVVTGLLRKELGFSGVVISDDLQMKAITAQYDLRETVCRAVNAGVDILLFGNNLAYDPDIAVKVQDLILDLVSAGEIDARALEASFQRIMRVKERL